MRETGIIAVSGIKNSGKTTLIRALIPLLARKGLRCAVIKHDGHSFDADREGTDTWKMLEAGAFGAAVFDGEKFQAVKRLPVSERDLMELYPEADLIILEGFKWTDYPKVEIVRKEVCPKPVCEPDSVIALVTDCNVSLPEFEKYRSIPVFKPEETEKIAEFMAGFIRHDRD